MQANPFLCATRCKEKMWVLSLCTPAQSCAHRERRSWQSGTQLEKGAKSSFYKRSACFSAAQTERRKLSQAIYNTLTVYVDRRVSSICDTRTQQWALPT